MSGNHVSPNGGRFHAVPGASVDDAAALTLRVTDTQRSTLHPACMLRRTAFALHGVQRLEAGPGNIRQYCFTKCRPLPHRTARFRR